MEHLDRYDVSCVPEQDGERQAVKLQAQGFHIRHPPKPHLLSERITKDEELFQTIHMGAVDVDIEKWLLVIDGLVENAFALTFEQLLKLPSTTIEAVHECFGSPLTPANTALWRVGNVLWTGVPLRLLLELAHPLPSAEFLWSEGLDSGTFADVYADRYQKDLPLSKAQATEVLVAYKINGNFLGRERGGPVRLVVPGWFGTNSTKWLCKISLHRERAPGPYTTTFYNAKDQDDPGLKVKPVWEVDVNSMIVRPASASILQDSEVKVEGWAWSHDGVAKVEITSSAGNSWHDAKLEPRVGFRWQKFALKLDLKPGEHTLMARATSLSGKSQALSERRNHAHSVNLKVES